jgi:hypothetical protein
MPIHLPSSNLTKLFAKEWLEVCPRTFEICNVSVSKIQAHAPWWLRPSSLCVILLETTMASEFEFRERLQVSKLKMLQCYFVVGILDSRRGWPVWRSDFIRNMGLESFWFFG